MFICMALLSYIFSIYILCLFHNIPKSRTFWNQILIFIFFIFTVRLFHLCTAMLKKGKRHKLPPIYDIYIELSFWWTKTCVPACVIKLRLLTSFYSIFKHFAIEICPTCWLKISELEETITIAAYIYIVYLRLNLDVKHKYFLLA